MARARNIKPGFYLNEELAQCSLLSRFIFPGIWMMADREGRLEDRPLRLKASIMPYDTIDMDAVLSELQTHGFIVRYVANGEKLIQIINFTKHQNPHKDEKVSSIPAPNLHSPCTVQEVLLNRTYPADSLNPDSLNPEPLSKPTPQAAKKDYPSEFLDAWKEYPSRPGSSKEDALKAWKARITAGESPDVITAGVIAYAAYCAATITDRTYIKMAATFFGKGKHYLSDWTIPTPSPPKSNRPAARLDDYLSQQGYGHDAEHTIEGTVISNDQPALGAVREPLRQVVDGQVGGTSARSG